MSQENVLSPSPEPCDVRSLAEKYLDTLSPKEKKAYFIAKEHLGSSFTLEKSVGFLSWKQSQPK